MLITKKSKVKISPRTMKHYADLGYMFQYGEVIEVDTKDLTKGSHCIVLIKCDFCECEYSKPYKGYLKSIENHNIDSCTKCKSEKAKLTNNEKYGSDFHMQTEDGMKKIKKATFEKFGVENVFQNEDIKTKIRETNIRKYGVTSPLQNEEIMSKVKKTNLERYGSEFGLKTIDIKNKIKETNLNKYGFENPAKNEHVKNKTEETNLIKYGYKSTILNEDVKNKAIETCIEKYGVSSPGKASHSHNARLKRKLTCIERYGVEHALSSSVVREKINKTLSSNGDVNTSSQQLEVFNMLNDKYFDCELNYPFEKFSLDIAVVVDNIKIDIEYDGWYWHQDSQRDRRRDEFLKSKGWKILRIKSGHKTPTHQQLEEKIKLLLTTDRTYTSIILGDWKEV